MKNIAISFSGFMNSYLVKGEPQLSAIDVFIFNCKSHHLFPTDFDLLNMARPVSVPCEVLRAQNHLVHCLASPWRNSIKKFAEMRKDYIKLSRVTKSLHAPTLEAERGQGDSNVDRIHIDDNLLALYDRFWDKIAHGNIPAYFRNEDCNHPCARYIGDWEHINDYQCEATNMTRTELLLRRTGFNVFEHGSWRTPGELDTSTKQLELKLVPS